LYAFARNINDAARKGNGNAMRSPLSSIAQLPSHLPMLPTASRLPLIFRTSQRLTSLVCCACRCSSIKQQRLRVFIVRRRVKQYDVSANSINGVYQNSALATYVVDNAGFYRLSSRITAQERYYSSKRRA